MTTVTKATHITINAANTVPTNVQVILQGQNQPVATQSPGCITSAKGGSTLFQPNRTDIGWQSVSGANSYNIYRAVNGGIYSLYANVTAATAATNFANYAALYPAPAQTFGNYIATQPGPASSINCAYSDTAATRCIGNGGQAGSTFNVTGNVVNGSTTVTVTAVVAGTVAVNQGIGTLAGCTTITTPNGSTTANPSGLPATTAAAGSVGYIPLGTIVTAVSISGGTGTITMSAAATGTANGITIGEVAWGNAGYTYYVTAVTGGAESGASAFAYLPFITNGNLVLCNGAFDSYVGTQQTAPAPSPLGYTTAVNWNPSGHPSFFNAFSGNSSVNYNLNTCGYNYINISFCPTISGLGPAGGLAEICGDAPECYPNGTAMSAYGPASWTVNQWSTYKMPVNIFNTDYTTGVPQTAMYKITWGINNTSPPACVVFSEYYFSVN